MAKALYRKWRPQKWDEVVAQEHVVQTLQNAVMHDRVAHAYLFAGPRGTGKTSTARLLAKAVNCLDEDMGNRPCNNCTHCQAFNADRFMDLIEIDAASNTSVDDVRDLREKINFSPSQGKFKVYIIDEVHMLSTAAFNALLKTLEEPPPHAIFILATTEIHKIPATVLSRCQRHEFRPIPIDVIVKHLTSKSKDEGINVEDDVFKEIARQATGSLRDAISLLDQLASTDEPVTLEKTQQILGTATSSNVIQIIDALIKQDSAQGLAQINTTLGNGTDPRQFSRQLVTYLRNVLLFKIGNVDLVQTAEEVTPKIKGHAEQFTMVELLNAIEAFNRATTEEHANWHPGLGLELAFTSYLTKLNTQPALAKTSVENKSKIQKQEKKTSPRIKKSVEKPSNEIPSKPTPSAAQKQAETTPDVAPTDQEHPIPKIDLEEADESQENEEKKTATDSQPEDVMSINDIQAAWGKVKSLVRKHNPRTEGILNSAKLVGIEENTLILGFTSEMVKGFMVKEGNLVLTRDILEEVLGQPLLIKCIVTTLQSNTLPENIKIDKDGMVGTATRDLGGKISSAKEAE